MKNLKIAAGLVMMILIATGGAFAKQANHAESDEAAIAAKANITIDSAIKAALEAAAGKAVRAELDEDNGRLVYEVEIVKADRQSVDVKVDADNGKVLKVDADKKDRKGHEDNEGGEE